MAQGRMRLLQVLDLPRERFEFAAGQFAYARAFMRAIKADEFCNLAQGEARDFRASYKAQPFKVSAVIKPVRAGASWRLFQQAFALIIANGLDTDAGGLRQFRDGEISGGGLSTPYHATEAREVALANQRRRNMSNIQHPSYDPFHHTHHRHHGGSPSLNRLAGSATLHCLSGCAIGEVLGMVIGAYLGLSNGATIGLAVVLAFFFGYALTLIPLFNARLPKRQALKLALASDTASITIMEIVDNAIMLVIPGAMDAGLDSKLFWVSLAIALAVAGIAAFPVNRWLIARGRGHALVHAYHKH